MAIKLRLLLAFFVLGFALTTEARLTVALLRSIPVARPERTRVTVNRRTARRLGLVIPPAIARSAEVLARIPHRVRGSSSRWHALSIRPRFAVPGDLSRSPPRAEAAGAPIWRTLDANVLATR